MIKSPGLSDKWASGAVASASGLHPAGRGFESLLAHHRPKKLRGLHRKLGIGVPTRVALMADGKRFDHLLQRLEWVGELLTVLSGPSFDAPGPWPFTLLGWRCETQGLFRC